jgi:hypothetical protein
MHRKNIRRWHKLLGASASLVAILAGLFVAPASAQAGPAVDMFWPDVSYTNQSTAYFYLTTTTKISNFEASDLLIVGTATGCTINDTFWPGNFFVIAVTNCSDGTLGLQLGANSVSDMSGNWGPEFGVPTNQMIIDRTAPTFSFDNVVTEVTDASFNLVATGYERVSLVNSLMKPTISGDGCYITGISTPNFSLTFAITGCNPGAHAVVTILKESYIDATGNIGPAADIVSPTINVAPIASTQAPPPLPTPTSTPAPTATPSSTPTPTATPSVTPSATPTPTATPQPTATPTQAAIAPIIELPEPPAPPAVPEPEPLELGSEQPEPIAAPNVAWALELAPEPIDDRVERTYASAAVTESSQPAETPSEPAPAPQIFTAVDPSEPAMNVSWVSPAASVLATALAAIGAGVFMRRRVVRTPRARFA